ncbi:MAG: hypothetical protein NT027_10890 [Proteobacteria bacterium]|nr:hypothetical protein [Pseudomonadota bacterium]
MAGKPIDQKVLDRYQSDYYVHTDLIFRFGVSLTCSREGGEKLVERTFSLLLDELTKVKGSNSPIDHLLSLSWQAWSQLRGENFHPWNHVLVSSLAKLDVDERAALYIVDMVGYSTTNAAKLMECSEKDLRIALASARASLVTGVVAVN